MRSYVAITLSVVTAIGCTAEPSRPTLRSLGPPAAAGGLAPNLAAVDGGLVLTWLEPFIADDGALWHRFVWSRFEHDRWSTPVVIASGPDFFANWADLPGMVEAADGRLYAYWLQKTAAETYAYSVRVALSRDSGASWEDLGWLNDDASPTEHGFVSMVPEESGVRAFWLDGRAMADGGPMALRTTRIDESIGPSRVIDSRVCECCSTDATQTQLGPLVAFRDRSESEVRDIGVVRWETGDWGPTRILAPDLWQIRACPVNGPEVAALESTVAVAWFTAADDRPRVRVAFSSDSGAEFGVATTIVSTQPLGRVGIVIEAPDRALVGWMEMADTERAAIRLVRVAGDGTAAVPITVATTSAARRSGVPRLLTLPNRVYVAWLDTGSGGNTLIRVTEIELSALPEPEVCS